jgi:AraC family transcriptional regulator
LQRARLKPNSPWFALLEDLPYAESDLEVAMAVGVKPRDSQRGGDWQGAPVSLTELPAVPNMASVIHEGEIDTFPSAYTQLYAWTQTNGYQVTGSCREIYLPEAGIDSWSTPSIHAGFTEVQCPVKRASIPISILSPEKRKERIMEPKIVNKPGFKTVGLSYVGKNEQGEIPQMWGAFNQRYCEIKAVENSLAYGLCFSEPEGAAEDEFEYIAAAEVADGQDIPEGMVYREVPDYTYAVFTHHGKLDKIGATYEYIYKTWLPQSDLELHPDKCDMEVYTEEFIPDSDDSKFYIYVAIK